MEDEKKKLYLKAEIQLQEETKELKEKASKVIELPPKDQKQPDLLYFSAIFVSSGENLNHAYFLPSELLAAEGTIINKALDIEHKENEIIGHIYERAFIDFKGNLLDIEEMASLETASLDRQNCHVAIAGIIYKNRFPDLAQEVADKKWCVSMECYFKDYDVKVGDLIISKNEAESLGIASSTNFFGRAAKVIKEGKEIAAGTVTRVLRNILFSGCGIVQQPANPPSIVLETAKEQEKDMSNDDTVVILNYDSLTEEVDNKVTSEEVETSRDGLMDDTLGTCVYYKKYLYDEENNLIGQDWCSAYNTSCTSFSRDTSDPDCLYIKDLSSMAKAQVEKALRSKAAADKRRELLDDLKAAQREAVKTQSR